MEHIHSDESSDHSDSAEYAMYLGAGKLVSLSK